MNERKSNLELLRIISMCGIIIMHYSGIGGGVHNNIFPSFSWFFTHLLNSFCIPLVNCFVLISGYFLIKRKMFSLRKPIELLLITAFYGVIAYIIYLVIEDGVVSIGEALKAIFPFSEGKRWFVETYIILILFAPFLNKLLCSLNKVHYQILLVMQLLIFCVWYSVGFSAPLLDDGYGIINFITLYMCGGYIRLYGKESKISSMSKQKCAMIYFIGAIATFVLSYFINPYGYAFITNIFGAISIFLLFLKWDIGSSTVINEVGKATFDVYFVHSDARTSCLLISELLGGKYVSDRLAMVPHVFGVIIAVWLIGIISYYIRSKIFNSMINPWLDKLHFVSHGEEI